ncbi:hypothetical protein, partial [Ralstonia solanacearum]|uniref:hypothetical protein n=1 Tax=Ralstonia solanacearum TaxID=305 RepID=UPI001E293D0D
LPLTRLIILGASNVFAIKGTVSSTLLGGLRPEHLVLGPFFFVPTAPVFSPGPNPGYAVVTPPAFRAALPGRNAA